MLTPEDTSRCTVLHQPTRLIWPKALARLFRNEPRRREVTARHMGVSLVEPGAVKMEGMQAQSAQRFANVKRLEREDIADA